MAICALSGGRRIGRRIAAPVFGEFMRTALAGQPPEPFRIPESIKLITVNPATGRQASGTKTALLEVFKVGTAPPDAADYIGAPPTSHSEGIGSGTGNRN